MIFIQIMTVSSDFIEICRGCNTFCCKLVKPPLTEKEKQDIIKNGGKDCFIEVEKGVYNIKSEKESFCPYLDDYICKIHDVKPKLCKVWPVVPRIIDDKRSFIVIKCPLYKHLTKEDIDKAKRECEEIPDLIVERLWNISPEMKEKYKIFEYEEV